VDGCARREGGGCEAGRVAAVKQAVVSWATARVNWRCARREGAGCEGWGVNPRVTPLLGSSGCGWEV